MVMLSMGCDGYLQKKSYLFRYREWGGIEAVIPKPDVNLGSFVCSGDIPEFNLETDKIKPCGAE
jgi:hypothetical protein